jgi:hypothetical protein
MDSILINGKGSVECLTQAKLESLVAPRLSGLLKAFNAAMSDKGFVKNSWDHLRVEAKFT